MDDDDDAGMLVVCRDIPGPHTGGPDCFCCPLEFPIDTPTEVIMTAMRAAQWRQ